MSEVWFISLRLLTLRTKLERNNKMPNVRSNEPRKLVVGGYSPLENNLGKGWWFSLELKKIVHHLRYFPIYFIYNYNLSTTNIHRGNFLINFSEIYIILNFFSHNLHIIVWFKICCNQEWSTNLNFKVTKYYIIMVFLTSRIQNCF